MAETESDRDKPITRGELQDALKSVINRLEGDCGWEPRGIEDSVSQSAKGAIAAALDRLMDELGLDRWADTY